MTFSGGSLSFTYTAKRISQNIENNRIKTNLMDKKLRETTNLRVEIIGTVNDKQWVYLVTWYKLPLT